MSDIEFIGMIQAQKVSEIHPARRPAIARHYEALAAAEAETAPGPDNPIKTLDRVLGR